MRKCNVMPVSTGQAGQAAEALAERVDAEKRRGQGVYRSVRWQQTMLAQSHGVARIARMNGQFLERMDSELAGWSGPVQRLRDAIENDEFELYCQPILQFAGDERYPMAEVLVRLREEERALLPPGEFLPVFEHYRMMAQLDRWVVRHTIKRLAGKSRIPRFTVNLSGQALEDEDFPRFVAAQLSSQQVTADKLLFEIDESDALLRLGACKRFSDATAPSAAPC